MTMRLSASSFAGTARTLVAVGTVSETFMFLTTAADAPRSGDCEPAATGGAGALAAGAGAFSAAGALGAAAGLGAGAAGFGAAGCCWGAACLAGAGAAVADAGFGAGAGEPLPEASVR